MNYVFESLKGKRYSFPTHINDLIIDRKDATASEVFAVIVEPGKAVHRHSHKNVEQIFYIIEGRGVLTVGADNKEYKVGPTQVVKIPPGTPHTIRARGKNPVTYLCIDCFCGKRRTKEPTWDDHVKTVCREQGYDYNHINGK